MSNFFYPLSLYYDGGIGPMYVAIIMSFIWLAFMITRPINMFITYVKTGKLDHSNYDMFMDNVGMVTTDFTLENIKKFFVDLFLNTKPEDLGYDAIMFLFVGLGLLMVAGLLPYIFVVWLVVYCIVKLARYLRKRVEMKEEFVEKLKGNR